MSECEFAYMRRRSAVPSNNHVYRIFISLFYSSESSSRLSQLFPVQ